MPPKSSWSRENTIAVIAITVSVVGILLSLFSPDVRHFLRLDQSDAANQGLTANNPNQVLPTTSTPQPSTSSHLAVMEIWSGTFIEVDGSSTNVRLEINSLDGGNFFGTWTNYQGVVTVNGHKETLNNIPGHIQTDLSNSVGITLTQATPIIYWHGQGNASGNIWPNGYYYTCSEEGLSLYTKSSITHLSRRVDNIGRSHPV